MTGAKSSHRSRRGGDAGVELISMTDALADLLTLPDASDPLQAPLHAANARAVETAIDTLENAFPSLPLRDFAQATDATTLVVGHAAGRLLAAVNAGSLLESLFGQLTLRPGNQLKLIRNKENRDPERTIIVSPGGYVEGHFRASAAAIASELDDGYTVVLDGIDLRSPDSTLLAGLFERAFGCSVNINGYLSSRTSTSFGAHWDDQEVVILQLLGHKDWTIEQPSALSMNKAAHGEGCSGQLAWQGRLGPGEAVYVPRGWGHLVNGVDELSFHFTITMPRFNGLHALNGVLERLARPPFPSKAGQPLSLSPGRAALEPLPVSMEVTERLVRRSVAYARFGMERRSTASLRGQIRALAHEDLSGALVRCPCPGGWVVVDAPDVAKSLRGGHTVLAGMAGEMLSIDHRHLEAIGSMTNGQVHEVTGALDHEVVRVLIRAGILEAVAEGELERLVKTRIQ